MFLIKNSMFTLILNGFYSNLIQFFFWTTDISQFYYNYFFTFLNYKPTIIISSNTSEVFMFLWLLILLLFSSVYYKVYSNTHSFSAQEFVENLFRLVISIIFITIIFLIISITFKKPYDFFFTVEFWELFLQSDLEKVKLFINLLSAILLFFFTEKSNLNSNWKKNPLFYSASLFEYPLFYLFSVFLCDVLLSSNHLFLTFLSIVGLSLCLYSLIAFDKNIYSIEAAAKYFSIGALASGLMLFGIFSFYQTSQTLFLTDLNIVFLSFENSLSLNILDYNLYLGLISFLFGFLFKLSAFPCHMWAPDVYDGSSMLITSFLMTVIKTAIFFYLIFFLLKALFFFKFIWGPFLILSGIGSIFVGTFGAFYQNRLKRFFAFTSMGQIGLSLISFGLFFTTSVFSLSFAILNFIIYIFTTFVFFCIFFTGLHLLNKPINSLNNTRFAINELSDFHLNIAFLLTINILSMAGIPPLIGFLTKFLILNLVFSFSPILLIILLLFHLVNTFNYLRLVQLIWFKKVIKFSIFNLTFSYLKSKNLVILDIFSWINLILILKIDLLINYFFVNF